MQSMKSLIAPFLAAALVALVTMVIVVSPAAAQGGTPPTANIQLQDGSQPGEVVVSWDAVPQAAYYRIGSVNMVRDYPIAKASTTGEWLEAFLYADVNARNFAVVNGRFSYTVRGLCQNTRHAITVLTSGNVTNTTEQFGGQYYWPQNPRWQFITTADHGGHCATASTTPPATNPTLQPDAPLSNAELARRVRPALGLVLTDDGYGTGFVVRSDGLMITNRHVVDGDDTVQVYMEDQDGGTASLTGQVLGRGILADLALVRLPTGRAYAALPLANSDAVAQGDEITAWGYPSASYLGIEPTLTRGIVSATNRTFDDTKFLQTDASIAGGSSGGPVVDRFGRVVGVNTAGLVDSDGNPIPGIYLAIASNEVSSRLNTMAAGGPAQATYRNLRFDYGYSINIPKGWYIDLETASSSQFYPYTGRRYAEIRKYESRPPFGSSSNELDQLADYIWNVELPEVSETWAYFEKVSSTKVTHTQAGFKGYRLEYHARFSPDLCALKIMSIVTVSSSFPGKPYGFDTVSAICEDNLSTYSTERNTILNSFRP